jgi:hypothetical protein
MRFLLAVSLLFCHTILAQTTMGPGVRILLGMTDEKPTPWDGSVTARGAEVQSVNGWRFERPDAVSGASWKASSRQPRLFINGLQFDLKDRPLPVVSNGVIVRLSEASPNAELAVTTTQGNFTVKIADLSLGKTVSELNGRVSIDLLPPVTRLTNDPDEQDYPASATAKDGTLWLAYTNFHHHQDHNELRAPMKSAPASRYTRAAPFACADLKATAVL